MREDPRRPAAGRDRPRDSISARRATPRRLRARRDRSITGPCRGAAATRVCCGLTNHLELARRPDLYGTPVIVGRWDEHVVAASEETLPFGVVPGMALRQAEHLCPQSTFVLPDEEADVRIRELFSAPPSHLAPGVRVRGVGIP